MKILHLIQKSQLRGAEVFASQLSSHINRLGHEAVIVYLFAGEGVLPFNGKKIALEGNSKRRLFDIRAWKKLGKIIREEKPDIIQANSGDTLKYAVFSRILCGWQQPIVFRNASTISLYIKSRLARKWNSILFGFASKIISVSEASRKDFSALFPEYYDRLVTVPIGIEHTSQQPDAREQKDKANPVEPSKFLVHVGGFSFEKNHQGLLNIFEKVLQHLPSAILHLVGDGPLKKQTEEIVRIKGLQSNVRFHGFRSNALEFIYSADVLLLPSIIEGMPGVILEAFYCKTPVVAYDVGGIGEVLINGKTGRLIQLHDESAFASAVVNTLNDNESNRVLIQNARELVMSAYLNKHITERFLEVYQSVLAKKHPGLIQLNNA